MDSRSNSPLRDDDNASVCSYDFIPSPHNEIASLNGPPAWHQDYQPQPDCQSPYERPTSLQPLTAIATQAQLGGVLHHVAEYNPPTMPSENDTTQHVHSTPQVQHDIGQFGQQVHSAAHHSSMMMGMFEESYPCTSRPQSFEHNALLGRPGNSMQPQWAPHLSYSHMLENTTAFQLPSSRPTHGPDPENHVHQGGAAVTGHEQASQAQNLGSQNPEPHNRPLTKQERSIAKMKLKDMLELLDLIEKLLRPPKTAIPRAHDEPETAIVELSWVYDIVGNEHMIFRHDISRLVLREDSTIRIIGKRIGLDDEYSRWLCGATYRSSSRLYIRKDQLELGLFRLKQVRKTQQGKNESAAKK